jgi:hypothetical protein
MFSNWCCQWCSSGGAATASFFGQWTTVRQWQGYSSNHGIQKLQQWRWWQRGRWWQVHSMMEVSGVFDGGGSVAGFDGGNGLQRGSSKREMVFDRQSGRWGWHLMVVFDGIDGWRQWWRQ